MKSVRYIWDNQLTHHHRIAWPEGLEKTLRHRICPHLPVGNDPKKLQRLVHEIVALLTERMAYELCCVAETDDDDASCDSDDCSSSSSSASSSRSL